MSGKRKTWWKRLVEEIQVGTGSPNLSLKSLSHLLPACLSAWCSQNHVLSSQLSHQLVRLWVQVPIAHKTISSIHNSVHTRY